ncbi:Beta-propeller repeat-containing protein, partial [Candidatus Methanophagaceae archaeon]
SGLTPGSIKPNIDFGKIPLYFIQNKGQVDKRAQFYAKASRYTLWLTKEGLVFDSIRSEKKKSEARNPKSETNPNDQNIKEKSGKNLKLNTKHSTLLTREVSRLLFIGSNKDPVITPIQKNQLKVNFFKGNDKSKWRSAPTSQAVLYSDLYKDIDLKVYGIEKEIEYDWIVKPGGNPDDIKFEYKNTLDTKINKDGDLEIKTEFGILIHKKPIAYQHSTHSLQLSAEIKGKSELSDIKANFKKISKNTYGFTTGKYDKTKPLIIDPVVLVYSSYLGGNHWQEGRGIAVDNNGYVYVTGFTISTDFPILNGYQTTYQGSTNNWGGDVFVTKFDTTKSGEASLLYSTYLGGSYDDSGYRIAVDKNGCTYITGATSSSDFPILNGYQTTFQGDWTGDIFISKLDTTKSGISSLLYSTYLGGNAYEGAWGIAADSIENVYVVGYTNSTDFPILNGFQTNLQGNCDGFITKIDTTKSGTVSLIYSTYLGGSGSDAGFGIVVDNRGYAYITGDTSSTDFPILNGHQTILQGYNNAFIAKIDTTKNGKSGLLYSTYLGGDQDDRGLGIDIDNNENAYITGQTTSSDFPILNGYQTTYHGRENPWGGDGFVAKFDTSKIGDSSLLYSTYLGGSNDEYGFRIAVDKNGYAYVTGTTNSIDFPTLKGYQMRFQGDRGWWGGDGFVTKFDTSKIGKSSLLYSTYIGGKSDEESNGIAVDSSGNAYITGFTSSTDFPTMKGYQMKRQGYLDAFLTKLSFINYHKIRVIVDGEGGSVDDKSHQVGNGKDVKIKIFSDTGYEIDKIIDNGIEMEVANPYVIYNIREDHEVFITFKRIKYPPVLSLTGERKTERSWIITKDFAELHISITEHETDPVEVLKYVLYKSISGIWAEKASYNASGSYTFIDKYINKNEKSSYKLTALSPEGEVITETEILIL